MADQALTLPLEAQQIRDLLPHRYPLLLVDRVIELEVGQSATGVKCVTQNEPFFQGHFPGKPMMPGVLIVEATAQLGAIVFLVDPAYRGMLPILGGMNKVRFRRVVVPGDVLTLHVQVERVKMGVGHALGTASVGDEIAAQGEIKFTFVDA